MKGLKVLVYVVVLTAIAGEGWFVASASGIRSVPSAQEAALAVQDFAGHFAAQADQTSARLGTTILSDSQELSEFSAHAVAEARRSLGRTLHLIAQDTEALSDFTGHLTAEARRSYSITNHLLAEDAQYLSGLASGVLHQTRQLAQNFTEDLKAPYLAAARVIREPLKEQRQQFAVALSRTGQVWSGFGGFYKTNFAGTLAVERRALSQQRQQIAFLSSTLTGKQPEPTPAATELAAGAIRPRGPAAQEADASTPTAAGEVLAASTTTEAATPAVANLSTYIAEQVQAVVSDYARKGLLTGPAGQQGPMGPPGPAGQTGAVASGNGQTTAVVGGYPIVTYVPANPSQGYSGGSLAGFGQLSAGALSSGDTTIGGTLNVSGAATLSSISASGNAAISGTLSAGTSTLSSLSVSGPVTLSGSTTIAGLTVTGLNPGLTLGSVAFQNAAGLSQDNNNFFYDSTNHRLGLGTTTPTQLLTVAGNTLITGSATTTGAQAVLGALTASGTSTLATTTVSQLTTSGNVGIGTTSPSQLLSVGSSGGSSALFAGTVTVGSTAINPVYGISSPSSMPFALAAFGDSLTAGTGGLAWPSQVSTSTGWSIYNGGNAGYTSTQIKTFMLSHPEHFGDFVIIWAGENNDTDPTTVKADIAAMVAALPTPKRYLILSIPNKSTEPAGSANYTTIIQLNNDLAALYPNNYLDIRSYLISQYNPSLPQDVTDHGNDIVPTSLRSDTTHMNTAGYALVASRIATWMLANNYATQPSVPRWLGASGGYFSGPVAINTSAVAGSGFQLDVTGNVRFSNLVNTPYVSTVNSGANTVFSMTSSGSQYGTIQVEPVANGGTWSLGYQSSPGTTKGTPVLSWNGNGNVGIGTTTPGNTLVVAGTSLQNGLAAFIGGITSAGSGSHSEQFGASANASASQSLAIGYTAAATSNNSIAIGAGATASTNSTVIAIGNFSSATGNSATALGYAASAGNTGSTALGNSANAAGSNSMALGQAATVANTETGGTAIGDGATVAKGSVGGGVNLAIGYLATAGEWRAIAIGAQSSSSAISATAIGFDSRASATHCSALGAC